MALIRILVVPSSDYLGHPFPQRHNQIFERLQDHHDFEVHVVRFALFKNARLTSRLRIHELSGTPKLGIGAYYLTNMNRHSSEIGRIVRDEEIDLVVLSNLAAPFAYDLANVLFGRQIPTIMDLPDYYPTSATGYIFDTLALPGRVLATTFNMMLRFMIRRSSAVTVASAGLYEYAKVQGARQVILVPNGISERFLTTHDGRAIRERLGFAPDDFIVGYIGSLDFWLDIRTLLAGIRLTKKKYPKTRCLLVGKGLHSQAYSDKVASWIKEEELQNDVVRLDFVPYEQVPEYIASLDVGTIPFDVRNPTAYYAAPNKMWEYLSQMKAVISAAIPEALRNADSVSIAYGAQDYMRYFLRIMSGDEHILLKKKRGYEKALGYTWRRSADSFAEACRQIVRES